MAHTDLITRVILKLDWSYALQVGGTISMVCFLVVVVLVLDVVVFLPVVVQIAVWSRCILTCSTSIRHW